MSRLFCRGDEPKLKGVNDLPRIEITTVAFLQNQWFRSPEKIRRIYEKHPGRRQQLIKGFLFMGCLTGRRLKAAFGDGVEQIIWEEVSTEIGGKSSSKFRADPEHIESVIQKFKPNIVLTFGSIATKAIQDFEGSMFSRSVIFQWCAGPHPTARYADVNQKLNKVATWWKDIRKGGDAH